MRYLVVLFTFIFFAITLDASSYARSIRVGSFKSEHRAQKAVKELRKFIDSNERLLEIKYELGFDIKVKKSGRHYLTVLEPLTDKRMVQETLDILRTKYPGTYPKKIRYKKEYAYLKNRNYNKIEHRVKKQIEHQKEDVEYRKINKKIDEMFAKKPIKQDIKEQTDIDKEVKTSTQKESKVSEDMLLEEKIKRKIAQIKREKEEAEANEFKIFGIGLGFSKDIFDSLNFDFFSDIKEDIKLDEKKEKLHDYIDGKLTKFNDYMLEIEILTAILLFLIALAVYLKFRKKKEDKISIQDIYS